MSAATTDPSRIDQPSATSRMRAWPLWATVSGVFGLIATVFTDARAGDTSDMDYTVTVRDIPPLDHELFRVGGMVGYVCVAALLVLAAVWHRRVAQKVTWSLGAPVVTFGLVASAAALTLAYGWKGALGNYLHGAAEAGRYDDQGLYTYYVMNDFSPYIGWVPVTVALGGLAWMAFRERLVSRGLGACAGFMAVAIYAVVGVTGVPGLPFLASLCLVVVGIWLAFGRSTIVREEAA